MLQIKAVMICQYYKKYHEMLDLKNRFFPLTSVLSNDTSVVSNQERTHIGHLRFLYPVPVLPLNRLIINRATFHIMAWLIGWMGDHNLTASTAEWPFAFHYLLSLGPPGTWWLGFTINPRTRVVVASLLQDYLVESFLHLVETLMISHCH